MIKYMLAPEHVFEERRNKRFRCRFCHWTGWEWERQYRVCLLGHPFHCHVCPMAFTTAQGRGTHNHYKHRRRKNNERD